MKELTTCVLSIGAVLLSGCANPQRTQNSETVASPITVTRSDAGPLTAYDYTAKQSTRVVADTSLRRSNVILNDSSSPLQITSFGLRTQTPDPTLERITGARLVYLFDFKLMPRTSITAWAIHDAVFDPLNHFVERFVTTNEAFTGDSKQLNGNEEHATNRMGWWKTAETGHLEKTLTSILFVATVRTADGKVWSCDRDAIKSQMKQLSFELPLSYEW